MYTWTLCELDLPNPTATYQIAFEGTNNWGYANVIDLVKIDNSSTGIYNSEATDGIKVYANNSKLYLKTVSQEPAFIYVHNIIGHFVMQGKTSDNFSSTLDVSSLSNGIYMVSVIKNNGVVVRRKVSIQK